MLPSVSSVYALMKGAKLLVQSSEQEGQSIVVMEAMACGLPPIVVSSRHSAAPQLLSSGIDGLVCEPSADGLSEAINETLRREDFRRSLSENAWAKARAFDWEDRALEVEEQYEEILQGRRGGANG